MSLTDSACKNAKCPTGSKIKRFSDAGGLYLEVNTAGGKLWRWKFRFEGREKRLALGAYPAVSLGEARQARDQAKALLAKGVDPAEAKQEEKRARRVATELTFEAIARCWWNDWRTDKTERYAGYVLRRLESDVFPEIGKRAIADLKARSFALVAEKIDARGAGELARRSLETCGQIMRYAVWKELIERNPLAEVKPGDGLKPRTVENHARIDVQDLPGLLRRIAAYDGNTYTRLGLQLMVLCFTRTSELILARWQEFDLNTRLWSIPAERMKMRRPHVVPLSRQAIEVLECLKLAHLNPERCQGEGLLFPGERDHAKPMSNNTLLHAVWRMGYKGRMTGHGFRGLASTCLNEMGFRSDVIEMQLAHVEENRVRAAYNAAQYIEERREMLQLWADYLDALRQSGEVIPLHEARALFSNKT